MRQRRAVEAWLAGCGIGGGGWVCVGVCWCGWLGLQGGYGWVVVVNWAMAVCLEVDRRQGMRRLVR